MGGRGKEEGQVGRDGVRTVLADGYGITECALHNARRGVQGANPFGEGQ